MTDWDKECDLLKEYLNLKIETLPSVVLYRLKSQGIMFTYEHTSFEDWKAKHQPKSKFYFNPWEFDREVEHLRKQELKYLNIKE